MNTLSIVIAVLGGVGYLGGWLMFIAARRYVKCLLELGDPDVTRALYKLGRSAGKAAVLRDGAADSEDDEMPNETPRRKSGTTEG